MDDLERKIMQALADNPRVEADEISVQDFAGDVTLRGTVGSVLQREQAARTTGHVAGVDSVTNHLRLEILGPERRSDADTEAAVLDALNADTAVRPYDVAVAVRDGTVTLTGLVDLPLQRGHAERVTLTVPGVAHVRNRLDVFFTVSADEVAERITDAIGFNAIVGADSITVTVVGNEITLSGTVRSRDDHDVALRAAAAAPGVAGVHDQIRVQG